jgi:hypothetical protein
MVNFRGYKFYTGSNTLVGGAGSTMHYRSKAQNKANEINKPVNVFMVSICSQTYVKTFNPIMETQ